MRTHSTSLLRVLLSIVAGQIVCAEAAAPVEAAGPLRVHPTNPRYFTDGTKAPDGSLKAVYLTGSHTWANLIDRGPSDPPQAFDFEGYLDLLQGHHHNFIRLWGRQVSWYHGYGEGELHAGPLAWSRTGPGNALDGWPKFDLTKLDQAYFDRLRARVIAASDRGIYVGIMLFGGSYECRGGWQGNPFHAQNNINGVDGDLSGEGEGTESHTLEAPSVTRLQEAYVRKVIDTVNDLDNVLYEISNEGEESSQQWQYHLIRFIHEYEAGKPKQHPVGMTAIGSGDAESNTVLSAGPAEWISPHTFAWGGVDNVPVADGGKVSLLDSDHWFVKDIYNHPAFGRDWVWRAFCRGHNPILMEHLSPLSFVDHEYPLTNDDAGYIASREAMGRTRRFAERMNLAAMTPSPDLASSGYCLADPGKEYLVYLPEGGAVMVDLSAATSELNVEWFDVENDKTVTMDPVAGGGKREVRPPFTGAAALYLSNSIVLGIDGSSFTINSQKTFLLGASYYGALGAPDDFIARDLDDLKSLGFNWIRVWAVWDTFDNNVSAVDTAGNARDPYLSRLKAVVAMAATRGMVVDVTLARMPCLPNQEAHLRAVETLAKALKGCRNVYFDLANERDQHYENVFVSYAELRALRDRVKAVDPDRLVTASGAPGDREDLARYLVEAGLDFICPHLDRDAGTEQRTADTTRKFLAWMKELGRAAPIHYQEPFRRDYLDYRGFWQPEVETFCTDLRNAMLGGAAGWCFHNGSSSPLERFPAGKRRSFDMRPSEGRLMDQLDAVERQFIKRAASCVHTAGTEVVVFPGQSIQDGGRRESAGNDLPHKGRCPPASASKAQGWRPIRR